MSWLAKFPVTNALAINGMALAWGTFAAWIAGKTIPDGWLPFVAAVGVTAAAQFTSKRVTWKPDSPQNGEP